MLLVVLVAVVMLLGPTGAEPGKWDHHSRSSKSTGRQQQQQQGRPVGATTITTSTVRTSPTTITTTTIRTTTTHVSRTLLRGRPHTVSAPAHRCQVPDEEVPTLPDGRSLNMDYVTTVPELLLEDKLLVAPVVFEGVMVSRTNTYKGLYFVSFKVLRVLKGRIHRQQLAGQVRLLFQTLPPATISGGVVDSYYHNSSSVTAASQRSSTGLRGNACPPVPFNVRTGRKYLLFVRKLSLGRYVAVVEPELVRKKTRKAVRRTFCPGCVSAPVVRPLPQRSVVVGRSLRLKCGLERTAFPPPTISWYKDGSRLLNSHTINILSKKKRSRLLVHQAGPAEGGMYTCQAENAVGTSQASTLVVVRQTAPAREASECPIQSFCLNGGSCLYYEMIGELVCRCTEGFAGQRCQFKKARVDPPHANRSACGPYGHDIHLAEICAAWNSPPIKEMTREEYQAWIEIEEQLKNLKKRKTGGIAAPPLGEE